MGHVYFKLVRPHIIALTYLKSHDKFCEDISITKALSSDEMLRFSDSLEIQGENECATQKVILNGKEICENKYKKYK